VKRKSIHLAHLHVARANSVGEQLGVGSGVATQMRALAIVMLVSGAVVAEPRVALVEDAGTPVRMRRT
jgi:hypothetical protein